MGTKAPPKIDISVLGSIEEKWIERVNRMRHVRLGTKRYREMECEFFVGALAALHAVGFELPANWPFARSCGEGRPIIDSDRFMKQTRIRHRPGLTKDKPCSKSN